MDLEDCAMSEPNLLKVGDKVDRENPDLYDVYLKERSISSALSVLGIAKRYNINNYCAELITELIFESKELPFVDMEPIEERRTVKGTIIPAEDFMCYALAQGEDYRTSTGRIKYRRIKDFINGWYHSNLPLRVTDDIIEMISSFERKLPVPRPKTIKSGCVSAKIVS